MQLTWNRPLTCNRTRTKLTTGLSCLFFFLSVKCLSENCLFPSIISTSQPRDCSTNSQQSRTRLSVVQPALRRREPRVAARDSSLQAKSRTMLIPRNVCLQQSRCSPVLKQPTKYVAIKSQKPCLDWTRAHLSRKTQFSRRSLWWRGAARRYPPHFVPHTRTRLADQRTNSLRQI